jgi:hypothetical protein
MPLKLQAPFIISARLLPALRIGNAVLSLDGMTQVSISHGQLVARRHAPGFILDIGSRSYRIDDIQSGAGGFRSLVEPFESLLSFMSACAESVRYRKRTGQPGENEHLFVPAVAQWCAENLSDIECAMCEVQDERGSPRHDLIREE